MRISTKDWKNYIEKLSKLNNTAGEKMSDYVARHGFDDPKIIDYAYGLVTKYGEGSASLSAMMYDAIAEMEGKILPPAEVAETPEYGEVAKAINGVRKHSQNPTSYGNIVNRLVKRTGADTMLQNAERDGAEFAWIPSGDTCAFCIALASRGWQHISKKALKNGHAEHIHANCDCNYTVRFDGKSSIEGYNPEEYLEMYESAEGNTPLEKINSMRAKYRSENRDKINAQKRAAYAAKVKEYTRNVMSNYPRMDVLKLPEKKYSEVEIYTMAYETERILLKHLDIKSEWSGKFKFNNSDNIYYKDWDCDIMTSYKTAPFTIMHEQIHARSISKCGLNADLIYYYYNMEEESAVNLLTQEIAKKEGLKIIPSKYDNNCDALRIINEHFKLSPSNYDFAKELIKYPPHERKDWILNSLKDMSLDKRLEFEKLWEEVIKNESS